MNLEGITGQMSIFDVMDALAEKPPALLNPGQIIYLVNRADVFRATVTKRNWECGGNNRGYTVLMENGCYDCIWNHSLGEYAFTSVEEAREQADRYISTHNGIIFSEDIKPIETVAYSYTRDCDRREMIAFYCDIGNDMYYIKEFMTLHHIIRGNKALKKFMKQQEFKYCNPKQIEYKPAFKNMYPCNELSDWDYAEARYSRLTQ